MKFLEYKEAVKRTCPTLPEFNGNSVILDSIHMTLGMFSEVYELNGHTDKVNLAEEITDILWYACNYANKRDIDLHSYIAVYSEGPTGEDSEAQYKNCLNQLINSISELQDYDKKEFAYGKTKEGVEQKRSFLINKIIFDLDGLYFYSDINSGDAMQNNIDKLIARFPIETGFTKEAANNRDLEAERKELEK